MAGFFCIHGKAGSKSAYRDVGYAFNLLCLRCFACTIERRDV